MMMLLMKLLQAVGNALDLVKRDETLLHVMAEELCASKGADLTPDAAEWQQRCEWWPRFHGVAASSGVVTLLRERIASSSLSPCVL